MITEVLSWCNQVTPVGFPLGPDFLHKYPVKPSCFPSGNTFSYSIVTLYASWDFSTLKDRMVHWSAFHSSVMMTTSSSQVFFGPSVHLLLQDM